MCVVMALPGEVWRYICDYVWCKDVYAMSVSRGMYEMVVAYVAGVGGGDWGTREGVNRMLYTRLDEVMCRPDVWVRSSSMLALCAAHGADMGRRDGRGRTVIHVLCGRPMRGLPDVFGGEMLNKKWRGELPLQRLLASYGGEDTEVRLDMCGRMLGMGASMRGRCNYRYNNTNVWGVVYDMLGRMGEEVFKTRGVELLRILALGTEDCKTRPFLNLCMGIRDKALKEVLYRRGMYNRYTHRLAVRHGDTETETLFTCGG